MVGVSHTLTSDSRGAVVPGVGAVLLVSADSAWGHPLEALSRLWLGSTGFLVDDCGIRT